jgi:hypothetical protein
MPIRTFYSMVITLGQFQEIHKLQKAEMDLEEKTTEMVAVLAGKTIKEIEDMPVPEFNKLSTKVIEVISKPIPIGKPQPTIAGYRITYEPAKLTRGQYVTLMHFMKMDVVENAHNIMAALVNEENHSEIADKMQAEPMETIYPACVFFCELYKTSILGLRKYLVKEMLKKKIPMKKCQEMLADLTNGLDGFTMQKEWPTSRVSA